MTPLQLDTKDVDQAPNDAADDWNVPNPLANPTDDSRFHDWDKPPPSTGTALAA